MVVNQVPWESVEFERLSEPFALCAVVFSWCIVPLVMCIMAMAAWLLVVMVVGGWVIVISCIMESCLVHAQLSGCWLVVHSCQFGSQCHVTCWAIVFGVKAMDAFWAWVGHSVGSKIHFVNGSRSWTALHPWGANLGSIAIVIPPPIWFQSIAWKNKHSSCSGWAYYISPCIRSTRWSLLGLLVETLDQNLGHQCLPPG